MSNDVVYQSKGALIQFIETNMGTITATAFIGDGSLLQNVTGSGGGGGGGISWDGSTANGVATFKDADEATVESNLTFDGSTLTVTGDAQVTNLNVATDIIHVGDTDTKIGFGANTQTYTCANSERLKLNSTGVGLMGATPIAGLAVTGDIETSGDVDIASGQYLRTNGIAAVASSGNKVILGSAAGSKTLALQSAAGEVLSIDAAGVVKFDVAPAAGTDNTVLVINSSNEIIRDEIDSRVWGSTLVDASSGASTRLAVFSDSNTIAGSAELTYDGSIFLVSDAAAQLQVVDTSLNYIITLLPSNGPKIQFGDTDFSNDSFMTIGAYGGINNIDTEGRDFHLFGTNTTTGLYFDESAGKFGIGTTAPTDLLTVATDASGEAVFSVAQYNNSTADDGPNILLKRARGTMASPAIVQDDDNLGSLRWYAYDGTDFTSIAAGIMAEVDGTPGANDTPGRLLFRTAADGSNSLTERMRIDSAGLVTVAGDLTVTGGDITLGAATSYIKDASGDNRISIIDAGEMILRDSGGGTELGISNGYVTVYNDLRVNDFARIDALWVGTTTTDPGDGNLVVEGTLTVGGSPMSTGHRAEFLDTGGGTYAGVNGAYWEMCQANSLNATAVLESTNQQYDMLGPAWSSQTLYHYAVSATPASTAGNVRRATDSSVANNFTGQHNVSPADSQLVENLEDNIGLIVVANGTFKRYDERPSVDAWVTGKEAITIAEALPCVELATTPNDKRAFGVISNRPNEYLVDTETGEYEEDQDGVAKGFGNIHSEQVRINSIGEGAIWVCDISGNLENGDYITTCEIPGLGMKQDDDLLHNYTVAKITQDCDFRINASNYNVVEFEYSGSTYRKAFVGCTYHCG